MQIDDDGIARRGLLVRHLVMPGLLDDTKSILSFLANEVSPDTYVNIMDQYYPAAKVSATRFAEINRRLHRQEYNAALRAACDAGLWRFDERVARHG